MKKQLTKKELILLSSTLFGMFFGAGNLIFPALLGPTAGSNLPVAFLGLFVTAVGLPLLAVAALGISRTDSVQALSCRVGRSYSVFFCTLLYLTIGPLFAIPRCASTSFAVGAVSLIGDLDPKLALAVFSLLFFAAVLAFSLKPSKIMTWIGKILTPIFLVLLAVLVVTALAHPLNSMASVSPAADYATGGAAFISGFLEGYNTLDALAGLAFGIIVITEVHRSGVTEPGAVAANTAKAGIFSCVFMGIIYFAIALVAVRSAEVCGSCTDGGAVLGTVAETYFGSVGAVLMLLLVTAACLKTAVGLVTSCSEAFVSIFPKGPSYRVWAVSFSVVAFLVANLGLSSIVAYCVPVLMFLYPLSITLILLALFDRFYHGSRAVYVWTTALTLPAAVVDFLGALSSTLQGSGVQNTALLDAITAVAAKILPLQGIGLGWIVPAAVGFVIGFVIHRVSERKRSA